MHSPATLSVISRSSSHCLILLVPILHAIFKLDHKVTKKSVVTNTLLIVAAIKKHLVFCEFGFF